jgi:hypothetical protein
MSEEQKTKELRDAFNREGNQPKRKITRIGIIGGQYQFTGFRIKDIPSMASNLQGTSDQPALGRSHDNVNGEHLEEFGPEQTRDQYLAKLEQFKDLVRELGGSVLNRRDDIVITIPRFQ